MFFFLFEIDESLTSKFQEHLSTACGIWFIFGSGNFAATATARNFGTRFSVPNLLINL